MAIETRQASRQAGMIPRTFHFIWVGDESRRPDNCIDTWRAAHPDWQFRLWGNAELEARG